MVDPKITDRIIQACQLSLEDTVLEIGPGQGVLTRKIAPQVKRLIAIETDRQLCQQLSVEFKDSNTDIIHADFLKYDLSLISGPVKIIGNLPYYISSPIIEKILQRPNVFYKAYFTLQLEFGQRLVAPLGSKVYGSFSCFVQYHSDAKLLFKIKNTAFRPIPQVLSCFIELSQPKVKPLSCLDEGVLFQLIRQAFSLRRKQIKNSLLPVVPAQILNEVLVLNQINPFSRAEDLSLDDFVRMANLVAKQYPTILRKSI